MPDISWCGGEAGDCGSRAGPWHPKQSILDGLRIRKGAPKKHHAVTVESL